VLFLVALAFGVASSVNFPVLILSMYWKGLTTRGALWGGIAGLVSSVGLVVLSPTVWVKILGNKAAIFPYDHPAIVSMTLAFFVTWLLSVTDKSARAAKEAEAYEEQYIRAQTGLGAGHRRAVAGGHVCDPGRSLPVCERHLRRDAGLHARGDDRHAPAPRGVPGDAGRDHRQLPPPGQRRGAEHPLHHHRLAPQPASRFTWRCMAPA
jgi:hypothetical protein